MAVVLSVIGRDKYYLAASGGKSPLLHCSYSVAAQLMVGMAGNGKRKLCKGIRGPESARPINFWLTLRAAMIYFRLKPDCRRGEES